MGTTLVVKGGEKPARRRRWGGEEGEGGDRGRGLELSE